MRRPAAFGARVCPFPLPAPTSFVRLVDLAAEFVQTDLDGVLCFVGGDVRCRRAFVDLLAEVFKAAVDGIVLGVGRTHRAVFSSRRATGNSGHRPCPRDWLRLG